MHVKFISRGTGSAGGAVDYLLNERDAAGQPRAGVEVLRGDPERVAAVTDSLAFEHGYRSTASARGAVLRPGLIRRSPTRNGLPAMTEPDRQHNDTPLQRPRFDSRRPWPAPRTSPTAPCGRGTTSTSSAG